MSAADNIQLQPDVSPALMAVRSSAWLGRADLPERFDVIVSDFSLAMVDRETIATAYDSWMAAKAQLRRRGYTIWEYRDEERCCFVATCAKRPNDKAQRRRDREASSATET